MMNSTGASQFQGYEITSKNIQARIFSKSSSITLADYIGSAALGVILGQYAGDGNEMTFANGNPNATNMALWHVGLMGLAQDVSLLLTGEGKLKEEMMNEEFLASVKQAATERNDRSLLRLWVAVMQYDAPESEFIVWRDYFLNSNSLAAPKLIEGLIATMLMNPYFLLRK